MENKKLTILLPLLYVVLVLISTITATKISTFWGFAATAGTIFYPITFMLKDMIQKKLGRKVARLAIWAAGGTMLLASLAFWVVSLLPADSHWALQSAYDSILTPVFRLTVASIIAGIVSELIDTQIFGKIFNKGHQLLASLTSNFVGIVVDSTIFVAIAFAGVLPLPVLWSIFFVQTVVKLAMAVIGSPSIFLVKRTTTETV